MKPVTRILVQTAFLFITASLLISLTLTSGVSAHSSPAAEYTTTGTIAAPLKINDKIPDFQADAYYKGNITKINTADYRGKWMVFVFYPADFTFVCPKELEEMATYYTNFTDLGAEVFSVSRDSAYVHKAWHNSTPQLQAIQYPMLADTTGNIGRTFGTLNETDGLSYRATFIVDPDGYVKVIEMHDNSFGRSTKELLRKLEAAKFVRENPGKVCPPSWDPGEETITPA